MILRPGNVRWEWKRYTEPTKSFFSGLKHLEPSIDNVNAMHCLSVSFSLPSGVFASMAVRELTGNAVSDDDGRHHAQEYMRKINSHAGAF
jgi:tRNA(Glu) U13 pseudouridine synthase TruD